MKRPKAVEAVVGATATVLKDRPRETACRACTLDEVKEKDTRRTGGAPREATGRNPVGAGIRVEVESAAQVRTNAEAKPTALMDGVVDCGNIWAAYERVLRNRGAAGVDGIGRDAFKAYLHRHWPTVKGRLVGGEYIPQPVRGAANKPHGGERLLGMPTLTDQRVHQALHQVLRPLFGLPFSASTYGSDQGRKRMLRARGQATLDSCTVSCRNKENPRVFNPLPAGVAENLFRERSVCPQPTPDPH